MRTKLERFGSWLCLAAASCLFTGFTWGKVTGKLGKGGGMVGRIMAFVIALCGWHNNWTVWSVLALILGTIGLGMVVIEAAEKLAFTLWGAMPRHNGEIVTRDYNFTIIDEVSGGLVAVLPAWILGNSPLEKLAILIVASILFTVWDITKWWPVKDVENGSKSLYPFDVILDDLVGGAMAGMVTAVLYIFVSMTAFALGTDLGQPLF